MNNLKELLKRKPSNFRSNQQWFDEISRELFYNFVISKKDLNKNIIKEYRFVEIEFYYYSEEDKESLDYITYPRNLKAGQWFFHRSGVDLTFESYGEGNNEKMKNFKGGGILIRGIQLINEIHFEEDKIIDIIFENFENKGYIFGPNKCVDELWDHFDAFSSEREEYPHLIKIDNKERLKGEIRNFKRHIRVDGGENAEKLKIKDWAARLFKDLNKEEIENYHKQIFNKVEALKYRYFCLPNFTYETLKMLDSKTRP